MKNALLVATLLLLVTSLAVSQNALPAGAAGAHFTRVYNPNAPALPPAQTMTYYGGPIMSGSANQIYIVYYGNWTNQDRSIINSWSANIGASPLYNANTTFYDNASPNNFVQPVVGFNKNTHTCNDNYSLGKFLNDANVQTIVSNAIASGCLPNDTNGVYFVLTAKDVHETAFGGGFCTLFCGYHTFSRSIVTGEDIKYSFVGNPAQCPSGCTGNVGVYGDTSSPNGDLGADGAVSIMFHELSEAVTDPLVTSTAYSAWGAGTCGENGDCCNFTFGPTSTGTNIKGSFHYNQTIGGRKYLLQEMFALSQGPPNFTNVPGTCVQSH
jgi:hypothetical protein